MDQMICHRLNQAKNKAFGGTQYQPMELSVRSRGTKNKVDVPSQLHEALDGKHKRSKVENIVIVVDEVKPDASGEVERVETKSKGGPADLASVPPVVTPSHDQVTQVSMGSTSAPMDITKEGVEKFSNLGPLKFENEYTLGDGSKILTDKFGKHVRVFPQGSDTTTFPTIDLSTWVRPHK